ncbi:hypothetical protein [Glutamicibacter sp. BSL13]
MIEIKSRAQKKQLEAFLTDEVPAENMAQIQCLKVDLIAPPVILASRAAPSLFHFPGLAGCFQPCKPSRKIHGSASPGVSSFGTSLTVFNEEKVT